MKGLSLHIGLNHVNPAGYDGWDGELAGCINDANSMESIAKSQGFTTARLIDQQATCSAVVCKINEIAGKLSSGDIFLLTYSGHGGQLPDSTGEEEDGYDETWVLYDRELLDNELYAVWSRFAAGVRIFVSSDSCHSGTIVRALYRQQRMARGRFSLPEFEKALKARISRSRPQRSLMIDKNVTTVLNKKRVIPVMTSLRAFKKREAEYQYAAAISGPKSKANIVAKLILISGCQDSQTSADGDVNGLFTEKLLEVWKNGSFKGDHKSFHDDILSLMPDDQTPNFMTLGTMLEPFIAEHPFSIQSAGTTTSTGTNTEDSSNTGGGSDSSKPSVECPASWGRNNQAPVLTIHKGVNPYYYVEVAASAELFDSEAHGAERRETNFYGTWDDQTVSSRLTASTFQIPAQAWNNIKQNGMLYFLVGTTSSSDPYTWDNYMTSFDLSSGEQPPCMEIVSIQPAEPDEPSHDEDSHDEFVLSASVGRSAPNRMADAKLVQQMLNHVTYNEGGPNPELVEDGKIGAKSIAAIERYQEYQGINADGVISPTGPTFAALKKNNLSIA